MGLDDAVRRERAKAAAASAAGEADAAVVAREIPIAQAKILDILRQTLMHLPATHPSQVLRIGRVKRFTGTRYELADRLWRLSDGFLFGSDLSIYDNLPKHQATLLNYGLHAGIRKGSIDPAAEVLSPDNNPVDLSRKIAVRPGEATIQVPASDPPRYSLPRSIGPNWAVGAFSVTSDGSIYIAVNDHGYDPSNDEYRLEDICAQLIVKMTA